MNQLLERHLKLLNDESQISKDILNQSGVFSVSKELVASTFGVPNTTGIGFPYFNLRGESLGFRLKKDIADDHGKYLQRKNSKLTLYFLKDEIEKLMDVSIPIIFTEGEKKCLSLYSNLPSVDKYAVVSIPGCNNYLDRDTNDIHDIIKAIPVQNRKIIFIGDSDFFYNLMVYEGYLRLIRFFYENGARVELIDLRIKETNVKIGVDDFMIKHGTDELLKRINNPFWIFDKNHIPSPSLSKNKQIQEVLSSNVLEDCNISFSEILNELKKKYDVNLANLREAKKQVMRHFNSFKPRAKPKSNEILHNDKQESVDEITDEIALKMGKIDGFFYNKDSSSIYEISKDEIDGLGSYYIHSTPHSLSPSLSMYLDYTRYYLNEEGDEVVTKKEHIPEKILATLLLGKRYKRHLRPLNFVSRTPVFIKDRLIQSSGYDQAGEVYILSEFIKSSSQSTHINRILDSFPFADDASKANALAMFLTHCFFLNEFVGKHPAFIIMGNCPNLGKTTLAQVSCILAEAKELPTLKFNEQNDDEMQKTIASMIVENNALIFDNIKSNRVISSPTIERSLTDRTLSFRLLGTNKNISRLNNVMFFFTLNDGLFCEDIQTRSVSIFLSSNSKNQIDLNFDVKEYVYRHREEIISELCTFVDKWIIESMPRSLKFNFPKYPFWANTLGNLLNVNGYYDFLKNLTLSTAKLDPILSAILNFVIEESISSNHEVEYYTSQDLCSLKEIREFAKQEGLSEKSLQTKTGRLLSKYSELDLPVFLNDLCYKVRICKSKSQSGGNNSEYRFEVVTSVTNLNLSEEKLKNSNEDKGAIQLSFDNKALHSNTSHNVTSSNLFSME